MLFQTILVVIIANYAACEKGYFTIIEETKIGTEIFDASKLLKDKIKPLSKFTIIGESNFQRAISIKPETGRTTVIDRIDREKLCIDFVGGEHQTDKCVKSLRVIITSNTNKEVVDLDFEIIDINDHAPMWSTQIIKVPYPESWKKSPIKLPLANDRDTGQNAVIKYYLQFGNSGNLNFNFESGDNRILLIPKYEIDYETVKFYNLSLVAEDRGNPSRSSILYIEVSVIDVNDNSPRFVQKVFRPSKAIYETTAVETKITVVEATDKDSDQNSKITYYIDPSMPKAIKDQFYVDPINGEVKLKQKLDYDRGSKSFSFIVIAKDNAPAPYELSSSVTVEISVADVNDEIPNISIFFTNSPPIRNVDGALCINVSENVSPQRYDLAHVSVDDFDEDDKNFINCFIDNKESFKLLPDIVKPKSFILSATKIFDREQQQLERVRIICQDNGKNENSKEIIVQITDENDNHPLFDHVFEYTINENISLRNQIIGRISAIDKDSDINAELQYKIVSIQPRTYINFHLNSDTGKLYVDQSLDREEQDHYNITIIATDKGQPSLTGTGYVILRVNDVNDWPPNFDSLEYKFKISEEVPSNTRVGMVHATDKDIGSNAVITYHFIADSFSYGFQRTNSLDKFHINSDTGDITTTGRLDRETRSSYLLIVEAMNPGVPRRYSASTTVHITVLDHNDNAPRFYSPANSSLISIDTDRSIGSEIIQLRANDIDEHKNSNIVYTIVSATDPYLFNLDFSSGILFLAKKVESYRKFRISVRACDTGLPHKCSADLVLYITTTKPTFVDSDSNADFTGTKTGLSESNGAIIACLVVIFVILIMAMVIMFFLIRNKQMLWKRRMETNYDKSPSLHGRNTDTNFDKNNAGSIYEAELRLLNERNKANNVMLNSMYSPKIYEDSPITCKPDSPCYRTIDAMVSSVYNPVSQMTTDLDRCQINCSPESKSNQDVYPQHLHFRGASEPSYRYTNLSGRSTSTANYPAKHSYYQSVAPSGTTTIRLKNNFNDEPQSDYDAQIMPRSLSLMKFYEKQSEPSENTPEKSFKYESGNRPKYVYEAFREGSFI